MQSWTGASVIERYWWSSAHTVLPNQTEGRQVPKQQNCCWTSRQKPFFLIKQLLLLSCASPSKYFPQPKAQLNWLNKNVKRYEGQFYKLITRKSYNSNTHSVKHFQYLQYCVSGSKLLLNNHRCTIYKWAHWEMLSSLLWYFCPQKPPGFTIQNRLSLIYVLSQPLGIP